MASGRLYYKGRQRRRQGDRPCTAPSPPRPPSAPQHSVLSASARLCGEVREEGINPQPPGQSLPPATPAEASLLLPEPPLVHRRGRCALGAGLRPRLRPLQLVRATRVSLPQSPKHERQPGGRSRAASLQPGQQEGARSRRGGARSPARGARAGGGGGARARAGPRPGPRPGECRRPRRAPELLALPRAAQTPCLCPPCCPALPPPTPPEETARW